MRRGVAKVADPAVDEAFTVLYMIRTIGQSILEDLPHGCAGPDLLGRETVHLGITPIADDQALLGIEHGKPLQHVVQGRVAARLGCGALSSPAPAGARAGRGWRNLEFSEVGRERLTGDLDCNRLSR